MLLPTVKRAGREAHRRALQPAESEPHRHLLAGLPGDLRVLPPSLTAPPMHETRSTNRTTGASSTTATTSPVVAASGAIPVEQHQQLVTLPPEPPYLGPVTTAESERVVPLAQVTLDALAEHLAEHPAREVQIEDRTDPLKPQTRGARLLFSTEAGTAVARHTWSDIFRPAARAAGLPVGTGLHALRHLYASLLIRYGESAKTVQRAGSGTAPPRPRWISTLTSGPMRTAGPGRLSRRRYHPVRTLCGPRKDRPSV